MHNPLSRDDIAKLRIWSAEERELAQYARQARQPLKAEYFSGRSDAFGSVPKMLPKEAAHNRLPAGFGRVLRTYRRAGYGVKAAMHRTWTEFKRRYAHNQAAVAEDLSRNAVIRRIRVALERRSGKTWSVTGGRGTAYGWITIDAPPRRRGWDLEGTQRVEAGRTGYASLSDRRDLATLLGLPGFVHAQGQMIPAGHDYYREFLDRAEGRAPRVHGTPYWDNPRKRRRRALTVPEQHLLRIARATLKMPDPMVGVMGGPTKEEARRILARYGMKPRGNPVVIDPSYCPRCERKRAIIQTAQGRMCRACAKFFGAVPGPLGRRNPWVVRRALPGGRGESCLFKTHPQAKQHQERHGGKIYYAKRVRPLRPKRNPELAAVAVEIAARAAVVYLRQHNLDANPKALEATLKSWVKITLLEALRDAKQALEAGMGSAAEATFQASMALAGIEAAKEAGFPKGMIR